MSDAEVSTVPASSGRLRVLSVLLLGAAMVNVPVPEASPWIDIRDNLVLLDEF